MSILNLQTNGEFVFNKKISKANYNFFRKHGYIVVKKAINKKSIKLIYDSIKKNTYKYSKLSKIKSIKNLHKSLLQLRKKNKKNFSFLFDSLTTLNLNFGILAENNIVNIVSNLLKVNTNLITLTDVAVRLDPPLDERNTLGWHQDSSYFRQNDSGKNGIALWSPINRLNKKHGFLEFLDKSHNLGPLNVKKKKSSGKYVSSKRNIDDKKLLGFKDIKSVDLKVGDILLMNLDLVHRSGKNISSEFRISLLGRYHNMIKDDFNSGLNIYKYSNKKIQKEVHG